MTQKFGLHTQLTMKTYSVLAISPVAKYDCARPVKSTSPRPGVPATFLYRVYPSRGPRRSEISSELQESWIAVLLTVVALSTGPTRGVGAGRVRTSAETLLYAESAPLVTMIQYSKKEKAWRFTSV